METKQHERPGPRISVCVHALQPAREDGRALRNATALARAGFAVSIVDIEHDSTRPHEENLEDIGVKNISLSDELQGEPVHLRHIFVPRRFSSYYDPTNYVMWLFFKCWRMLCAVIWLLRTPADVYHANDVAALPACYVAALLRRKPLIFDAHELPLGDALYTSRTHFRFLRTVSVYLLRAMLPSCSGIITVSPPLVRELQRLYGGKKAVLVRNIPPYQKPHFDDWLRRKVGVGSKTRIALYQGYLQKDRGLDGLVRAAQFLAPGIVIVMLGRGEYQTELEALITREGVGDRVKILPAVPYAELLEWTASADIGLIVSPPTCSANVEVFLPNKLFEYLMAGLPVLASPLEAVEEIIRTYDVGRILPSLEPEVLGRGISTILADRAALESMRCNALAASSHELRWDVEEQRLIALYHNALAKRPGDTTQKL